MDRGYIRGFFDGEGSVGLFHCGKKRPEAVRPRLELSNTCLIILKEIYDFLVDEGYHPSITSYAHIVGRKTIHYRLSLKRWREIIKFADEIGTNHPDKQARFAAIRAHYSLVKLRNSRGDAVAAVQQMLKHSQKML